MPDLRSALETAAEQYRPPVTPSFTAVERRVHRRRTGRRAAVVGAALVAVAGAAAGAALLPEQRDGLRFAEPTAHPSGAVPEPTPYAVPTTPPTRDVLPPAWRGLGTSGTSTAWRLTRLYDDGRRLLVQWRTACGQRGHARFAESDEHVIVQVTGVIRSPKTCMGVAHAEVVLAKPLGDRPLLHAPTGHLGDPADDRPLAERWAEPPQWPGEPWFREGDEVPRDELVLSAGAEHCDWHQATFLAGSALLPRGGESMDVFWRDPNGTLDHEPPAQRDFRAGAQLPDDARWTGYEQRGVQLWTAASDGGRFVYLVRSADPSDAERWVRGRAGCA